MSQSATFLYKPFARDQIDVATLAYFRQRNRGRIYSLVLDEFVQSGLTQADLAARLGKRPEIICRWLGSPGNWGIDTVSDLLFAIKGAEAEYSIHYPLDEPPSNYCEPEWLSEADDAARRQLIETTTPSIAAPMPSDIGQTLVIDEINGGQNAA
ncbi:MAG: hypothetical protein AB7V61_07225 [Methylocystis sp.]|uniref:hypothetical protein n=1 Tax=Methylocystis sp. TaxID=1911079 RepID=UPI003D13FCA1